MQHLIVNADAWEKKSPITVVPLLKLCYFLEIFMIPCNHKACKDYLQESY